MYELKIPKERVGCLIGKKGEKKREIEKITKSKMKVSSEGDVEIFGEGIGGYVCEKIVKAIGRGFNPDIAERLVSDAYAFEIIDIKEFSGKSKKKYVRLKSRLIGTDGKARKIIERLTGCALVVYGKTISIIGEIDGANVAFRGVEKLLKGSPHGPVYSYIEREMKKLRSI